MDILLDAAYHAFVACFAFLALLLWWTGDPYASQRERMVRETIENRDVKNPDVLRVMRATPRHLFVPESQRKAAYEDHPLPIGYGQTISQPYIVALMTEMLEPAKTLRVLEIGTGSGYQAAVLAQLVGQVYSVEVVPELAATAKAALASLGYKNVTVKHGDGYQGWKEEAPFDRIILTASPPEVPQALVDQLKEGGKLIGPVGRTPFTQELIVVEKLAGGKIRRRSGIPVIFVPMVRPGSERN